jgi:alanyl-tRNA synthetase
MLIADGVTPSNEGRGYVLRRLIRRAVRSMRLLGVEKACLPELLPASRDAMKGVYPIVETDFDRISRIAYAEEKAFLRTIASGTARLEDAVKDSKAAGQPLSGADAFALHDTYGFPIDLTLEMAEEAGLKVDEPEFRKLMLEQRQRAQADAKGKKGSHADLSAFQELLSAGETVFTGYTELTGESKVRGILTGGRKVSQGVWNAMYSARSKPDWSSAASWSLLSIWRRRASAPSTMGAAPPTKPRTPPVLRR